MRGEKLRQVRRVNLALLKEQVTLEEIAERSGTNAAYLSQILNEVIQRGGKNPRSMSDAYAEKIETGLHLPRGWMDTPHDADQLIPQEPTNGVPVWADDADLDDDHYARIDRLDVKVSAGNGRIVYDASPKAKPQVFRREWLHKKGLKEENLMCIYADGDSMSPTITDGAILLVDRADTRIQDNRVYIIRFGSEIRVKRLAVRADGGVTVKSDNPAWDPVEVPADQMEHVAIIGRVVWQAGEL